MARIVLSWFFLAVFAVAMAEEKYTTKFDNVDLDALLKNERLLKKALDCLMDKGNCTPDIAELKKVLPDALQNECAKCNDKQKEGAKKVLKFLIDEKKTEFGELEEKYDPEGVYRKRYESLAAKEGVKI